MPKLPGLRVHKPFGYPAEESIGFEQAQYVLFDFGPTYIVAVEGEVVSSYNELVELASREAFRNRETLEVWLYPFDVGGG